MLKRHKADMAIISIALTLLVFGRLYAAIGHDDRLTQVAAALPTLRLLSFLTVTKKFLRATWLGIRASASLIPLIAFSLYFFGVVAVELLGCVDGMEFGAKDEIPHVSFDTLEYAFLTMFTLYLGENMDPIK